MSSSLISWARVFIYGRMIAYDVLFVYFDHFHTSQYFVSQVINSEYDQEIPQSQTTWRLGQSDLDLFSYLYSICASDTWSVFFFDMYVRAWSWPLGQSICIYWSCVILALRLSQHYHWIDPDNVGVYNSIRLVSWNRSHSVSGRRGAAKFCALRFKNCWFHILLPLTSECHPETILPRVKKQSFDKQMS